MSKVFKGKPFINLFFVFILFFSFTNFAYSQNSNLEEEKTICTIYFTGVGCPHCAKTDQNVLQKLPDEYNLYVIEYEIYQSSINAPLLYEYNQRYNSGLGVPLIIFSEGDTLIGDKTLNSQIGHKLDDLDNGNPCQLLGKNAEIENLDIISLPGEPKIWAKNKILLYDGGEGNNEILLKILLSKNPDATLNNYSFPEIEPQKVALSSANVTYDKAVKVDGWIFQYNSGVIDSGVVEADVTTKEKITDNTQQKIPEENDQLTPEDLSVAKILSLAVVDAINPCALAVLTLMLIAIITYNPKNRKNIILTGLAFTTSVFVLYLFYGLVLIKFFQIIQVLTEIRIVLYSILGGAAILLGLLNIKDYFFYKPGCAGTEMPMSWRPKVNKIISGITSPKGAFVVGAFVTVFLLPCTIGPYVIASGILSFLNILKTLPWLLLYNFIFVLPMIIITIIIYLGLTKVEDVSGWKDKNIRKLHLISGIIILLLGIAMLAGWV